MRLLFKKFQIYTQKYIQIQYGAIKNVYLFITYYYKVLQKIQILSIRLLFALIFRVILQNISEHKVYTNVCIYILYLTNTSAISIHRSMNEIFFRRGEEEKLPIFISFLFKFSFSVIPPTHIIFVLFL